MSRATIETYYRTFNEKNWDAFFALLAEDLAHDVNNSPTESGKQAFKKFMDRMNSCYEENVSPVMIFSTDDPNRFATEYVVTGKYLKTDIGLPEARGQKYCIPGGAFFEVKNDKITRVTNYYNLQQWLDQINGR